MLALAKYSLKGPYHAASVVGMLAIAAVFLPLLVGQSFITAMITAVLIVMASALVGLIILTQGSASGLKAIFVSIFGITLVTTLVLKAPTLGLSIGLAQWLPIVILAQTLKNTKSLAFMMLAGLVLAIGAIALQFLIWRDLEAMLLPVFQQSLAGLSENPALSSATLEEFTQLLVHRMVLLVVPTMYLLFVSIMLLSRWMQAKLANSDGYHREFNAISLGKPVALAGLVILILSIWLDRDWITSVAMAVMVAFLYQGIAVVHSKLATNKRKALILGIFYALLIISPKVVAVSSIAGMIDNWLIFRKKRNIEST
jgi:hypothetical protein